MALTPRLDLRQSQQLVMTPQLQQAIKLLQLSNLELADYVTEEVEKNPLLEISDGPDERASDNPDSEADRRRDEKSNEGASADEMQSSDKALTGSDDSMAGSDSPLDANLEINQFNNDAVSDRVGSESPSGSLEMPGSIRGIGPSGDDRSLDQTLEGEESLHENLRRQMVMVIADPAHRLIATHLIDMVDESGYIDSDQADDIPDRLGCSVEDVEQILGALQTLEPSGVFARSLAECLAIQLIERDRFDPAMQTLVENLELLARRDIAKLKKLCGVDGDDMADMVRELRELDPKPGLIFGGHAAPPVVPDIYVMKNAQGLWTVELNSDTLPRVLMNSKYLAELEDTATGREAKTFISDCVSTANWLVKALDQRARTILKVSSELLKYQEAFFEYGVRHLRPLTLKEVADEIEMHESTVSRVTTGKYMATPRGMFELKYFFTASISSAYGGDSHSAESVRDRIKELIDHEDPKKILSDDKIVQILVDGGIDIARRTVAKYRESMKIPSSVQRRRVKNMAL